ncbi:coiled-coil domain-containing protein 15 [Chlamydotis macqueenii]
MLPPAKERPRGAKGQRGGLQARPLLQSWRVLAERTQSVAPVGVWVESASGEPEQGLAFASAFRVEEELKEQQREKAASLRRFQGEVRQRVNQQVRLWRKQQLQKSYEAAERESCVAVQYVDSALHLTPGKNTCLFRSHPAPAIRGPGTRAVPAQRQETQSEPFQLQAAKLSNTVKQVRRRLASCKTVPQGAGPPKLPGSVWTQENSESCKMATAPAEDESEQLVLAGHHDLPAELQDQRPAPHQPEQDDDFYIKIEFEKFRDGSVKDSSLPEPPQRPHADDRAPLVLWAGADQEETEKQEEEHFLLLLSAFLQLMGRPSQRTSSSLQRRNEYLRYRRLFMDIEREQVKEQRRQRERQKRIAEMKSGKENQRRAEERRMQETETADQREPPAGEGTCETLAQLKLEERRAKTKENQQRKKEYVRYVEALRAQLREKIELHNIDLPLLCSCGSDFWASHPDTCANNCVFYKNHKAYSRALQSVVLSCHPTDGSSSAKLPLRGLAALCARSGKRP